MEKQLASRENPVVKQYIRLLTSRKAREESGLFVVEGGKLIMEALGAGCEPVQLFATDEAWQKQAESLRFAEQQAAEMFRISPSVADKLAQAVSTQGFFGVFRQPEKKPLVISPQGRYLLLSALQDPGNVGTVLRTAAAFGVDGIIVTSDCPDIYGMKVLRASMGGVFKVSVTITENMEQMIRYLQDAGIRVYAAALKEQAISVRDAGLGRGCAVVIGNEGAGLPEQIAAVCDQAVIIPMHPGNESLNAAMAAGILLWEMSRG